MRNMLDRARLFADDGVVRAEHLPESLGAAHVRPAPASPPPASTPSRAEAEELELRRLVQAGGLTRRELAERMGLSERTMYRRLKALGLA